MRAHLALASAISALALPLSASAQGLELYDFPNFQGASVGIDREVANLGPGAFDNLTTSVRVTSGAWEACDGANFTGQCVVLTQDVWDLETLGINNRISSLRPAQTGGQPGFGQPDFGQPNFGGPGGGQQPMLVLYENTDYRGRSATYYARADNLRFEGFDDRARSVEMVGEWTLCEGANLSARCETFDSSVPDLSRYALAGTISSAAPNAGPVAGPGAPNFPDFPPQQGDRMLAGTQAAFFPAPNITPARLTLCLRGDARACESEVDVYCRNQPGGWREGAYYSIDPRSGALTDVLCVR